MASSNSDPPQRLLIPMKIDAFVLNPSVCNGGANDAKIASLSLPDYTGLRVDSKTIKSDVFPSVDLAFSSPASRNRRITDVGNGELRQNRCGVYLTWLLPKVYRMGSVASESATQWQGDNLRKSGHPMPKDKQRPVFRPLPVRWLVVRQLDDAPEGMPALQGWVLEGDRKQSLQDLVQRGADVDVEATPYIHMSDNEDASSFDLRSQADVFTGYKARLDDWSEVGHDAERVNLTLLHTSNEYLADFQPHNPNVFSMLDTFEYVDPDGNTVTLSDATASYYVIGWHSDEEKDPFHLDIDANITLGERLAACGLQFKEPDSADVTTWSTASQSTQVLCHGAIYDVAYSYNSAPATVPANASGQLLGNQMPIALGTTELDALLAHVRAHQDDATFSKIETSILAIQSMLFAQDDGVDMQLAAEDEVQNHNFSRRSGGSVFQVTGPSTQKGQDSSPPPLTESQQVRLRNLNLVQEDLDLCIRTQQQLQWSLFAAWWKCMTDPSLNDVDQVNLLSTRIQKLAVTIQNLVNQIGNERYSLSQSIGKPLQPAARPPFYQPRDPTIAIGGVSSAWPYDYLLPLQVRLVSQIVATSSIDTTFGNLVRQKLPQSLQAAALSLLSEFVSLKGEDTYDASKVTGHLPLYHDIDKNPDTDGMCRDRWNNRQPWFPLFMEWEAEYWHIPMDLWDLGERVDRSGKTVTAFGIKSDVNLADYEANAVKQGKGPDKRRISGRISIQPQIGQSLASKIQQLFDHTPASELDDILSPDERNDLLTAVRRLQFLSTPLRGIIDHLLTRSHGTHVSPNIWRRVDERPQPILAATANSKGFSEDVLRLIGQQAGMVPYSSEYNLEELKYCPFKPCTHGQLRFLKLNIIDRFGQGIRALDTDQRAYEPELYPCASEFYACQPVQGDPDKPNTVLETAGDGCQFIQMPPQINQYARLNGQFIIRETDSYPELIDRHGYWRPSCEWENPIWGWILINNINHTIQLFQPDGTFYYQVRLGGPTGAQVDSPFPTAQQNNQQLDFFVARLRDTDYLLAVMDVLNQALDNKPTTPYSYPQSLACSIGRPLALVNTGWDLELAVAAETNQSTGNSYPNPEQPLSKYRFRLKLGDKDRSYDGLVGFFSLYNTPRGDGCMINFDTLYTYYPSTSTTGNPTKKIDASTYGSLAPFFLRPDKKTTFDPIPAQELAHKRNKKMLPFAVLMDPFRAVHGYTGILPSFGLKLPGWMWKTAVERMRIVLSVGPLLEIPRPPVYDETYELQTQDQIKVCPKDQLPNGGVVTPTPSAAQDWVWLQPYAVPSGDDGVSGSEDVETAYMCLPVGKRDDRPRLENGPYTTLEGYLLLGKPAAQPQTESQS
ncbi:hypothetical protein MY11210_002842 [Beauveria gryllotalpidicola]